ncbi:MAG: hypothetical protein A3G80_11645 [Betaproteobacteria bacterium RIFCSPLOWO2_12_FULL_62_13b]|nr:MAG: hypothetical protein A3G80_11645 [Betaproteobacteria bacterium RIFCSPLOWO2_12_FULL_62_13b]
MNTIMSRVAAIVLFCVSAGSALAQDYPNKPVRWVVGFPPGGGTDIVARIVGAKMQDAMGVPAIIENKPGAGGIIATEFIARSNPDGYTLLVGGSNAMTVNPVVYAKLSYDPLKDFIPITNLTQSPIVVAVHPSVPANSVRELIAYVKANPGKINFSSANVQTQLVGEMFSQKTGARIIYVPYKGGGPAISAAVTGEVSMTIMDSGSLATQVKGGRLRALAVTTTTRASAMPDLPTMEESGVPGFDIGTWFGLFAPAGTPSAIVSKLNAAVVGVLNQPDTRERLAAVGVEPAGGTPEEFAARIRSDIARYGPVAKAANIRVE